MANWGKWLEGVSAGTIIVVGVSLFFIPEPITSFWGALIILAGIVVFFVGWWRDRQDTTSSSSSTSMATSRT